MADGECEEIFKQWLGEHQGLIFKVVRAYAATLEDQDDLFQEVLLQLWFSIPNFQEKAKVSTWIYRVALNTALVWNRSKQKRRKYRTAIAEYRPQHSNRSEQSEEVTGQLYEAIRKLSKIDASVVLMHLDGLAYSEMAEILGISVSNVDVKLNRAKKQLVRLLKGLVDDF
jgi:RNA polymerase sigma-70 factor (ECF subfamily)